MNYTNLLPAMNFENNPGANRFINTPNFSYLRLTGFPLCCFDWLRRRRHCLEQQRLPPQCPVPVFADPDKCPGRQYGGIGRWSPIFRFDRGRLRFCQRFATENQPCPSGQTVHGKRRNNDETHRRITKRKAGRNITGSECAGQG